MQHGKGLMIYVLGLIVLCADMCRAAEPTQTLCTGVKGFATPQAAWQACCEATKARQWGAMYDCLSPAAQSENVFECLGGLWFTIRWHDLNHSDNAEVRRLVARFDALAKAHAIDWKEFEEAGSGEETDRDEWREVCLRRMKNHRQFFAEVMPIVNKLRKLVVGRSLKSAEEDSKAKDGQKDPDDLGRLRDVKIRGDRATAKITVRVDENLVIIIGGKRVRYATQSKFFRRIDGRWYVASETGEPVVAPLHEIAESDVPYSKQFTMDAGDALRFGLPGGKQVAVWCHGGLMNLAAAEQTTTSGLKTSWGEKPFKHVDSERVRQTGGSSVLGDTKSYIKRGSVVTHGGKTSTYKLFVDRWEFDIIEDLKSKDALNVTIRVLKRQDDSR